MKLLLDENIPGKLTRRFEQHETSHVKHLAWQGLKNGALLAAAKDEAFEVLVTTDVSLYNQQKARLYGIAVLVLRVFQNTSVGIIPLIEKAQRIAHSLQPGEVEYLYIDERLRLSDKRKWRGEFAD